MMKMACFALSLFLLAPVAAQSTADVASDGQGQQILIDQSAAALDSRVSVDQIGFANTITVEQRDALSSADILVDGTDNEQILTQSGGAENILALETTGTANIAIIDQNGEIDGANDASIIQSGNSNRAEISQSALVGAANLLTLNQDGENNNALLSQTGSGNSLTLSQSGNDNSAELGQNGTGLSLSIDQSGGANIIINQSDF